MKELLKRIAKSNRHLKNLLQKYLDYKRSKIYNNSCQNNEICQNMVIFEAFMGRKYADSPRAIYEQMIKDDRFKDFIFVWSFKDPDKKKDIPELKRAILIQHRSSAYYNYYGKTKYIVSNSRIDILIKKRKEQVYIQTWHGTPLKRLGYDIHIGNNALYTKEEMCRFYKLDSARYNYMLSPSPFCTEKFSSAFNLPVNSPKCEIVEEGYPRNDFLSTFTQEDVLRIKKELQIPDHKKVILYAPTWRDNQHKNSIGYTYQVEVDFDYLRKALEDDYIILFRAHYFIANSFDFSKYKGFVYNVSEYENINDLYVVSDVLMTDYSSVFFDYSILKRPMIFYMYDLEFYENETRGFYISLEDLPGPIVQTEAECVQELKKEFVYDDKYKRFNERFTSLEDGHATERVINRCFK